MAKVTDRPARLVVIRHGESLRNLAKKGETYFADDAARRRIQGIPDHKIALTEEGHRQARATGVVLREMFPPPDYLYHSGYLRTLQTAEDVLEAYSEEERSSIQVRMNEFLRERDPGYTYDMTTEEAEAAFPWLNEYWNTFGSFLSRPPGGESIADVTARVYTVLNMLFRDRAGMNIFLVTHGGTIRAIRYLLEHHTYDWASKWPKGERPGNCGITVYEFDPDAGRLMLRVQNLVVWQPSSD
jgi:broad specificity phosphatase PhoE